MTFIDDFNRKLWAFVLKTKDQVLSVFKEFHARAERESGQKLKDVRTDNGGEYRGQFELYCKTQGIKLEYPVPKTIELNGLVERMNQTIMARVRSTLSHAKLPKLYWVEAMLTVVYLMNKSRSVSLNGDVPHKVWSLDRKKCLLPALKGVRMLSICACCKRLEVKVGQQIQAMHILGVLIR